MKKLCCLLFLALSLSACAVRGTGGSLIGEIPKSEIIQLIVIDIVDYFSAENAPGHTSLNLLTPKENSKNDFSYGLENEFRQRGFTISTESNLAISYVFDMLENGEYYVQIRFADKDKQSYESIARIYSAQGKPSSNWTYKSEDKHSLWSKETWQTIPLMD